MDTRRFRKSALTGMTLSLFILVFTLCANCERLPIKTYSVAEGLAGNQINKIVRDTRGFLWICTNEGLSRFDGYIFENFGVDQGLPHNNVTDFLETREGEYWVGTYGGLVRFNPKGGRNGTVADANAPGGTDRMFSLVNPEGTNQAALAISVIVEDQAGVIWCGTLNGLFRLERTDGRYTLRPIEIGMPHDYREQSIVSDLVQDRKGMIWIASPSGLYRMTSDLGYKRFTERDGLPEQYIQSLSMDRDGQLWAGTRSTGIFRFSNKLDNSLLLGFRLTFNDGSQHGWINQIKQTSDRRYWAATAAGLIEFFPEPDHSGNLFNSYTERNGLAYHEITSLAEDSGGNLWLGSSAGAMKLARNGFITYGEQDGVTLVNAIFSDWRGRVCFRGYVPGQRSLGQSGGSRANAVQFESETPVTKLGCFDGRRFDWMIPDALARYDSLGWVGENVTLQSRAGEWWIGTGDGLYRFSSTDKLSGLRHAQPIAHYSLKDGLAANQVFRLFEDSQQNIWISTTSSPANGLAMWSHETGTLVDYSNSPGLPPIRENLARSFAEDLSGSVWIGFNNGLARYHNGQFTFFTVNQGLPAAGIGYIEADHTGRIWLASSIGGLIRLDDPTVERPVFVRYTSAEGLSSNSTGVITEDLAGHIFVTTGHGLDELDTVTGQFRHFTTADGLASGAILSAFCDQGGNLWVGTLKGLSRFTPLRNEVTAQAPPVMFLGLRVAGSSRTISEVGETSIELADLSANENEIQLEFTSLSFYSGDTLRYQYKLEGANSSWSALDHGRALTLANLAPGRYRILVRAVNANGIFSAVPAVLSFRIMRPIWQRWWFVLIVGAIVAAIAFTVYRSHVSRIIEVERLRVRIATDLHDDIGAGLSRVAILTEVVKQQVAGNAEHSLPLLTEIADSSRNLVASMRDIVWAMGSGQNELIDVVLRVRQFASDVLDARCIEWSFTLSEELEKIKLTSSQRRHVFLIFKEAINNAVRYSECRSVSLSLTTVDDRLEGEIGDDGVGFESDVICRRSTGGHGIANMKKRAIEIGGNVTVDTAPGMGTKLRLSIPLKHR